MPYQAQIVCLANSRKPHGKCIAGKIWGGDNHGTWVRPVSNRQHDSISDLERTCQTGQYAQLRDLLSISFSNAHGHVFQQENHVIQHPPVWVHNGQASIADLANLVDNPLVLWENSHHSYSGCNDKVPAEILLHQRHSLYLIRPQNIRIRVSAEGAYRGDGTLKARATFSYNRINYSLIITDHDVERYYQQQGAGQYLPEGINYFTISLGDVSNGFAYKLIAAVI
ncbi:hypothetical protein SAMN04490185_4724 [Pseudomonas frederiksbergensis]|uniref:Dual OB-containing domain-containing protein n=1 Tax=Pseudomonas frederiksbergensis TaxID=104087 RepID=A0A1H5FC11_9PSED|nr:hypothetical protein [Pseudomonas frederiksbergensis]SEE00744.1 hypothetical protein SAMN04490185_4724 [Pseudomonas frederiksbergensis]